MITCQSAVAMRTYAPLSSYLQPIPNADIDRGVIPLDSLPADWWNWLWQNITLNEGHIVRFINSVFSEINSVLSAAGVSPSTASTTDLRDAIQALAQVVATSSVPGSVLSSTLNGKLNVIADGTATINGLGTPSDLQTTADNVVAAINEVLTLASGKAPTSHASTDSTYGVGTTQQFGHVKLCDGASAATSACGVAATPAAVKSVADTLASYQSVNNIAVAGKAPTSHASTDSTYGVGTTQQFGHVKVTNGCGLSISGGTISLAAPGYNCLGNVTTIRFNGNTYAPTAGVIDLGTLPTPPAVCICQQAIASSTSGNFYSLLGGGLRRTTTGVDTVNLTGLSWDPVCKSLSWGSSAETGIALGHSSNACCFSNALGHSSQACCFSTALGACSQARNCSTSLGYCSQACNYSTSLGYNSDASSVSTALGYGSGASCFSTALGNNATASCCGTALGNNASVTSQGGVAVGAGAISACINCKGRCFWINTIGDMYKLHIYTGATVTQAFEWCDLSKLLQCMFRCMYSGRYSTCTMIYLGGAQTGGAWCSNSSTLCSSYEEFRFYGALGKYSCGACTCWVNIYWGNCWRTLNCTGTGAVPWLNCTNRTILIAGTIAGV